MVLGDSCLSSDLAACEVRSIKKVPLRNVLSCASSLMIASYYTESPIYAGYGE